MTAELRGRIAALRAAGATDLEFTGGEPTIRPDLAELAAYAREIGFLNVSMISNGLRLATPRYADKLIDAGINDFLFSLHGHVAAVHDEHTSLPGSFQRIIGAIHNVRARGGRCRITATVTSQNYLYLTQMLDLFISLGAECIHLAVFSPVANAVGTEPRFQVKYSDAANAIKSAIDRHEPQLPPLSVKYIPFCFMVGYERYVMNLYQQNFDPDDWNYYFSNKIRRASRWYSRMAFDAASLMGALFAKDWSTPLKHGWFGLKVFGFTRLVELLRKKRLPACRGCAYDVVCDHVWKDYLHQYGSSEIVPVEGPKLKDPAWSYVMARYRDPGRRVGAVSGASPAAIRLVAR